jgi:hypothetical protein
MEKQDNNMPNNLHDSIKSSNLKTRMVNYSRKWFRVKIIYLKRNPQIIPLLGLIIACMIYTFALSIHSRTINYMPYNIDAFCAFLITLCSILNIFTFINFYQKKNYLLFVLVIIMSLTQIGLDIRYLGTIRLFYIEYSDRVVDFANYMSASYNNTITHIIVLIISLILIICFMVYFMH